MPTPYSPPPLIGIKGGGSQTVNTVPIGAPDQTTQPAAPQVVNVTIVGGLHEAENVRDLIEAINEQTDDGVILNATIT